MNNSDANAEGTPPDNEPTKTSRKSANQTSKKKVSKKSVKSQSSKKRAFPAITLEDALKVPEAIRASNNAHPWQTELVAKACGTTRKATKFFYLAAASRDYGLTKGSRSSATIAISDLGTSMADSTLKRNTPR